MFYCHCAYNLLMKLKKITIPVLLTLMQSSHWTNSLLIKIITTIIKQSLPAYKTGLKAVNCLAGRQILFSMASRSFQKLLQSHYFVTLIIPNIPYHGMQRCSWNSSCPTNGKYQLWGGSNSISFSPCHDSQPAFHMRLYCGLVTNQLTGTWAFSRNAWFMLSFPLWGHKWPAQRYSLRCSQITRHKSSIWQTV